MREFIPDDFFEKMLREYDLLVLRLADRGKKVWLSRFRRLDYYKAHRITGMRHWSVIYDKWWSCKFMRQQFERIIFATAPQMTFELRDDIIRAAVCRMVRIYMAKRYPELAPTVSPHAQDCWIFQDRRVRKWQN